MIMTVPEYLAFEEASQTRHEFVGGEIYAFAGTTVRLNRIAGNVYWTFADAGDRIGCDALIGDVKVRLPGDIFYYPDVMAVCDQNDDDPLIKTRPCVIAEVLSDSTRAIDLREKLMFYRQLESLGTYLIIEQNERKVYHHWRDDEQLWWSETIADTRPLAIPCLGIEITLADIYRNLVYVPAAG